MSGSGHNGALTTAGMKLRKAMQDGFVLAPGCHDALSARLVEANGFPAVYVSGSNVVESYAAMPDMGLLSLSELATVGARIADAVDLPVIMDGEDGFGDVHHVARTVREFERAGVAAIHIEDVARKRGVTKLGLAPIEEVTAKIKAAKDAQTDPSFMIIARTDASMESAEAMIERGNAYAEAGADVVFTIMHQQGILCEPERARTVYEAMPGAIAAPLMTNTPMGGDISAGDAERMGYAILCVPSYAFALGVTAVNNAFKALAANRQIEHVREHSPLSLAEIADLCHLARYREREERYAAG